MNAELQSRLDEMRKPIEQALDHALPAADARPACLSKALRHAVLTGGKRLRPILCLAAAEAVKGDPSTAMPAALAIEMMHAYTLVHDDLPCMDDDVSRRGQPTVHIAFGEDLAVLTGDALQALAFEMLSRTPETKPGTLSAMLRVLASAAGAAGVVGGQVEDMRAPSPPDAATVAFVHRHKTADLFEAATRLGALAAGGSARNIERLGLYGRHIGLAFQIRDDLLDRNDVGKDGRQELSCLAIFTPAEARQQAVEHVGKACDALDGLPVSAQLLRNLAWGLLDRPC